MVASSPATTSETFIPAVGLSSSDAACAAQMVGVVFRIFAHGGGGVGAEKAGTRRREDGSDSMQVRQHDKKGRRRDDKVQARYGAEQCK